MLMRAARGLTWDEYEALPLADPETGACPNCEGRYYSNIGPLLNTRPSVYQCKGTEWPNRDGYEFVYPCGTFFRGLPDVHYNAGWFAAATVCEFLQRFAPAEGTHSDE